MPITGSSWAGTISTPAASAGLSSARFELTGSTSVTANVPFTVPFSVTDWNDIASVSNSSGKVSFSAAGKYLITAYVGWSAANVPGSLSIVTGKSDSQDTVFEVDNEAATSTNPTQTMSVSGVHQFAAGDWLRIVVQESNGTQTLTSGSLNLVRIGTSVLTLGAGFVQTDSTWTTLETAWRNGTINPTPPSTWSTAGFNDSSWEAPGWLVPASLIPPQWVAAPSSAGYLASLYAYNTGQIDGCTVYCRKEFQVTGTPSNGQFKYLFDDSGSLYVNGTLVAGPGAGTYNAVTTLNVSGSLFHAGTNCVGAIIQNSNFVNDWAHNPFMSSLTLTVT